MRAAPGSRLPRPLLQAGCRERDPRWRIRSVAYVIDGTAIQWRGPSNRESNRSLCENSPRLTAALALEITPYFPYARFRRGVQVLDGVPGAPTFGVASAAGCRWSARSRLSAEWRAPRLG